jgi:6-phosphogluconolactonase
MVAEPLRDPAECVAAFIGLFLTMFLVSCGSGTSSTICPDSSSNSSTCTCGGNGAQSCPAMLKEYLYTSGDGGQVQTFSIDVNTGGLSGPTATATGPAIAGGAAAAVNNQFLFFSDPLHAQLDGFSISQGTLSTLAGSPFAIGTPSIPQGLASPTGSNWLYAADDGGVDAFTISATGIPTAIAGSPFPSGTNLYLTADPSGKFLYTSVDDTPGGIFGFTIGTDGALTEIAGSPFTIPGQTVANSQPSGIVDNGSYVYAALSGSNQIAAFSVDSGSGVLTPLAGSPFVAGSEPTVLALSGIFLYAINSVDQTISGYNTNSSTGALTPLANSPFAIAGTAMSSDFTGTYLYVSGSTGIQAYSVDSSTGNLIAIAGSPFAASGEVSLIAIQVP